MRLFTIVILVGLCSCSASKTEQGASNTSETVSQSQAAASETTDDEVTTEPAQGKAVEEGLPLWSTYNTQDLPDLEKRVELKEFTLWKCNYNDLTTQLSGEQAQVELPVNTGLTSFSLENSGTMSPELAAKFPDIRSYKGASDDNSIKARVDTNEEGFFGEFQTVEGTYFISPYLKGSKVYYALYTEDAVPPNPRDSTYK